MFDACVQEEWLRLHIEYLLDLYSSTKIKKNKLGGAYVAQGYRKVSAGRHEGRDYLEELGIERKILLKWIFQKNDLGTWIGLILCRIEKIRGN